MRYEFFIARKLRLGGEENKKKSAPILNIAIAGIILAIVIMILSVSIVCGFKHEITSKIYSLDSHIRISPAMNTSRPSPLEVNEFNNTLDGLNFIDHIEPITEKTILLKTLNNFEGLTIRGYDDNKHNLFLKQSIIEGKMPNLAKDGNLTQIAISQNVANLMNLKVGDKVFGYFIDDNVKVRNFTISGIYKTDFEDFDKHFIIGNQTLLRQLSEWPGIQCSYLSVTLNNVDNLRYDTQLIYDKITNYLIQHPSEKSYQISNIRDNYASYFSWLNLLDTNIIIILTLMSLVTAFTLISGLLIIILERINTIGILKTIGVANASIRRIFIILAQKLILKSILWGNIIGIGLALIQQYFHILKLNADVYYMPYVPIEINWGYIIILNIAIVILSYAALIAPSYVITSITPAKSLKFE